jgi:diguanylate cyclase (GGDEF)-like protein
MSSKPLLANIIVAAATVVFIIANAGYSVHRDYESTVAEHEVMARDLVSVVADQAARSIEDTDLALRQIGDIVRSGGGLEVFKGKKDWEALRRIADRIPGGTGVLIADPGGMIVASSNTSNPPPMNVADRDFMRVLAEKDILCIGASVFSKTDENEVFYSINRRISDRQGNFVGVASASITSSYLTDFFSGFKKNPGIAVFRGDGKIIARRPNVKEFIGQSIADRPLFQVRLKESPDGVLRAPSPMDGIDRINAYKRVNDTGMVVLVGIPWEAVTEGWRGRTWRIGLIAFLSVAIILLAARWGNASIRKAIQAQSEREKAVVAREGAYKALHHALLDHLTGLPARALFVEQASNLQSQCGPNDRLAIMIVDLDDFKSVNDTWGHEKGDEVLVKAAAALGAALRETDVAGRLGGDEFGVCIAAPAELIGERARFIAGRIVESMGAIGMGIGCSLGATVFPASCEGLSCALRRADEAMYVAKRSGKNQFSVWGDARQDGKEWAAHSSCQWWDSERIKS